MITKCLFITLNNTRYLLHALQVYDVYGEEGLKGGAPPPGAEGGMPGFGGMGGAGGPGFQSFSFRPGGYSGMDNERAFNIFANLFGGAEGFGAARSAPRSRVRMFSNRGAANPGFGGESAFWRVDKNVVVICYKQTVLQPHNHMLFAVCKGQQVCAGCGGFGQCASCVGLIRGPSK